MSVFELIFCRSGTISDFFKVRAWGNDRFRSVSARRIEPDRIEF